MTVGELIEELKKWNPERRVLVREYDSGSGERDASGSGERDVEPGDLHEIFFRRKKVVMIE